jgi:hypothetical protein
MPGVCSSIWISGASARSEHQTVDAAFQQFHRGRRVGQRIALDFALLHPVQFQDLAEQARRAGAFRAEVDLLAAQLGQLGDGRLALSSRRNSHSGSTNRLPSDTAFALGHFLVGGAALHEGDIDLALLQFAGSRWSRPTAPASP